MVAWQALLLHNPASLSSLRLCKIKFPCCFLGSSLHKRFRVAFIHLFCKTLRPVKWRHSWGSAWIPPGQNAGKGTSLCLLHTRELDASKCTWAGNISVHAGQQLKAARPSARAQRVESGLQTQPVLGCVEWVKVTVHGSKDEDIWPGV